MSRLSQPWQLLVAILARLDVQEHNTHLPHAAFREQTPDEMHWNTGVTVPTELEAAQQQARQARAEANRQRTCSACEPVTVNLN
jgi:hypothetical protein